MASSAYDPIPILASNSKTAPPQAFVLRLSEDTLNALRTLVASGTFDGLELDLAGTDSVLHLPSFPPVSLAPVAADPPIEILAHSSAFHASPLVLHSTASTRFSVRQTAVSEATKTKLRQSAEQAARDKSDRKIIKLDHEPSTKPSKGKAKTKPLLASSSSSKHDLQIPNHLRASSSKPLSTGSNGSSGMRASSPAEAMRGRVMTPGSGSTPGRSGSKEGGSTTQLRTRALQLLALGPSSLRDLAAKVREPEDDVAEVLKSIAFANSATQLYRLRPESYLHLDIYGWPQYSQADRNKLVAAATEALDGLGLSRGSPEWRQVLDPEYAKHMAAAAAAAAKPHPFVPSALKREASPRPDMGAPSPQTDEGSSSKPEPTVKKKGAKKETVKKEAVKKEKVGPSSSTSSLPDIKKKDTPSDSKTKGKRKVREDDGAASPSQEDSSATKKRKTAATSSSRTTDSVSTDLISSPLKTSVVAQRSPPAKTLPPPPSSLPSRPRPESSVAPPQPVPPAPSSIAPAPISSAAAIASASAARRKASPTFTSSSSSAADSDSDSDSSKSSSSSTSSSSSAPPPPPDLPSDARWLRSRFHTLYPEYISLSARLDAERNRSERVVRGEASSPAGGPADDKERPKSSSRSKSRETATLKKVVKMVKRYTQLGVELEAIKHKLAEMNSNSKKQHGRRASSKTSSR